MIKQNDKFTRPRDYFANHPVFTHAEFVSAHTRQGRSAHTSNSILADQISAGRLIRIKRGVYATVPVGCDSTSYLPLPPLVASKLSDDAVVAYHSALAFHGYAYSVWFREQYITSRRLEPFRFRGVEYVAVQAPSVIRNLKDFGGGIEKKENGDGEVRVMSLEKTLVDLLHSPGLGGGWEEVWRSLSGIEFFNLDAVIKFTLQMQSSLTVARVGFFLDKQRDSLMVSDEHLQTLSEYKPKKETYLDRRRKPGKLVKRWNLIVSNEVLNREWEEPRSDWA